VGGISPPLDPSFLGREVKRKGSSVHSKGAPPENLQKTKGLERLRGRNDNLIHRNKKNSNVRRGRYKRDR